VPGAIFFETSTRRIERNCGASAWFTFAQNTCIILP
jgi:hypothetical protein